MFRRFKLAYSFYNLFNKRKLDYNIPFYKKIGLNKFYFSPISSKDFVGIDPSILLNSSFSKSIVDTDIFKSTSIENQKSIHDFDNNGFALLRNYLNEDEVNAINDEIDNLLKSGSIEFKYGNKLMFAIHHSLLLKNIGNKPELIELLSAFFKDNAFLFQSINFLTGSQQKTHSDSIHMTTFPQGGLLGVWIALEDIDQDNGALHYYPGSHKLPYFLNKDYQNEGTFFMIGDKKYTEYEKMIEGKILEFQLEKKIFTAKKGDLLIWHANLFHGGEPHINKQKSRKSMVFHYYKDNSICYHEITQRPTLMDI